MNFSKTRVAALVMAVLLVGAAGLGAAAFDTETSTTSTTSDVTSSSVDTITFDPGNDSKTLRVQTDGFTGNETDLALKIYPEDTTTETLLYENTSDPVNESDGQYAFIENHSDLSELPIGYETGDYGVEVINETDGTIVAEGNITLDKSASDDATARIMVANTSLSSSALVPDSFELTAAETGWLSTLNYFANDTEEDTANVNAHSNIAGNGSTLVLDIEDAGTQDSIDAAIPSDAESGDWLTQIHVASNLNWAPVYYDSAPDSVDSDDTYAVYDSTAEEIEVHHGDSFENVEVTSVKMTTNEDLGLFENWNRYNRLGLGFLGL